MVLAKSSDTGDYRLVISVCTRWGGGRWPRSPPRSAAPSETRTAPPTDVCRKTTEVIKVNVFTGFLEQDNDKICESTYDTEARATVLWGGQPLGHAGGCGPSGGCGLALLLCPAPHPAGLACLFCRRRR